MYLDFNPLCIPFRNGQNTNHLNVGYVMLRAIKLGIISFAPEEAGKP